MAYVRRLCRRRSAGREGNRSLSLLMMRISDAAIECPGSTSVRCLRLDVVQVKRVRPTSVVEIESLSLAARQRRDMPNPLLHVPALSVP